MHYLPLLLFSCLHDSWSSLFCPLHLLDHRHQISLLAHEVLTFITDFLSPLLSLLLFSWLALDSTLSECEDTDIFFWSLSLSFKSKWSQGQPPWHIPSMQGTYLCNLAVSQQCKMLPMSWASPSTGHRRQTSSTEQNKLLVFQQFNIILA